MFYFHSRLIIRLLYGVTLNRTRALLLSSRIIALHLAAMPLGMVLPCSATDLHFLTEPSSDGHALSPPSLSARIADAAIKFRRFAPVPRVTFYDMAMPRDETEAKQVRMNGLLLVTSLSQSANDLPLNRLYVRVGEYVTELIKLTRVPSHVDNEDPVGVTFGPNRIDSLYLLPISLVADGSAVYTELSGNRGEFKICDLASVDNAFRGALVGRAAPPHDSSTVALRMFIMREYPGFIVK